MPNNKIEIPFKDDGKIKKAAQRLREKTGRTEIPIEVEKIIEIDYKLDVVPIPGVQKEYDVDALSLFDKVCNVIIISNEQVKSNIK